MSNCFNTTYWKGYFSSIEALLFLCQNYLDIFMWPCSVYFLSVFGLTKFYWSVFSSILSSLSCDWVYLTSILFHLIFSSTSSVCFYKVHFFAEVFCFSFVSRQLRIGHWRVFRTAALKSSTGNSSSRCKSLFKSFLIQILAFIFLAIMSDSSAVP